MKGSIPLVLLLLGAGCLNEPAAPTPTTQPTAMPTPGETDIGSTGTLTEANSRFALDILRALDAETPGENLVISPYSIATALQMVYGGSAGTTQRAMVGALSLGNAEPTLEEQARALLLNLTSADENATLRIGSSLWIDQEFGPEVNVSFPARVQESYLAEAFIADFRDPSTVDDVNAWASDKTAGKIPTVLQRISQDEVMFLLNAVYFKGAWTKGFNKTCTHAADFVRDDGRSVQVDMMCGGSGYAYAQSPESTTARLSYGDGRFAMYVILPSGGTKLDAFVDAWDGEVPQVQHGEVVLHMPRLRLATRSLDLAPALSALGMGIAFTDRADFSRIAPSLYLSRVVHDAVLEVDEEGTVAAAVTTVGVGVTSYTPPIEITLDRPFLLAIRDDASGTLLFIAKVHDPSLP